MIQRISPVHPSVGYRSYSNPNSQNTLITQTANWPTKQSKVSYESYDYGTSRSKKVKYRGDLLGKPVRVPVGFQVGSEYIDRLYRNEKWQRFTELLNSDRPGQQQGLSYLVENALDETLVRAAAFIMDLDVVAVRWVYFYNVATGYDTERMDFMYRINVGE